MNDYHYHHDHHRRNLSFEGNGAEMSMKMVLRMGLEYQIIEEDINILDYQKMSRLAWHFKVVPNIRF